jgi:hypothetical protein
VLFPGVTFADAAGEICKGAGAVSGGGCTDNGVSLSTVAKNIIQVFAIVIGIVGVIMIMVGGFKYITANGDSSSIASAKNTIIYALVGLVVAASAQTIVWFVLDNTTK